MLNIHIKEKFHCMKKRRILGMIITICLLLGGCASDNGNTGIFQQEETVIESALEGGVSGNGVEQKAGDAEKEESAEGEAQNALLLQKESPRLAEMVAEQSEVLEGYGVFLEEYTPQMMNNSVEGPAFSLIYLDGDDVPELVVIEGYAHACGGYVYTFEEGKVVPIGEEYGSGYGQYGGMSYWEKEGIVFGEYDQGGNIYCDVYQIEGSKDTLLQSYSTRWELPTEGEEAIPIFTVDGKEVSEEEYRAVCDKWDMTKSKVIQYGDCRTLTEGDIRSMLTEELENLILTQEEVTKMNRKFLK